MINVSEARMLDRVRIYFSFPAEIGFTVDVEAKVNDVLCQYSLAYVLEKGEEWELRIGHLLDEKTREVKQINYEPLNVFSKDIISQTIKLLPEIEEQLEQRRSVWDRYQSLPKEEADRAFAAGEFKDIQEDLAIM